MTVRIDLDAEGNEILRDWNVEPEHGIPAAFTPDKKRFIGYGRTRAEAERNANDLRSSVVADQG